MTELEKEMSKDIILHARVENIKIIILLLLGLAITIICIILIYFKAEEYITGMNIGIMPFTFFISGFGLGIIFICIALIYEIKELKINNKSLKIIKTKKAEEIEIDENM